MEISVLAQRAHCGPDRCIQRIYSAARKACAAILFVLLVASAAHAQTTVTIAWDRNTDAYTSGYRIYYGTASGNYQWSLDAGNQVSAPLSLSTGTYYVTVRAYNSAYQYGPASAEASINLATPTTPTTTPTAAIQASMQSATTALVSWQTTNAVSATINGVTVATRGSTTVPVSANTTFTVIATSSTGATARASASVTVSPTSTTSPTAAIQASMQSATTALVSWQTTNAVSATINGVTVATRGSTTVPVSANTTFTVIATSSTGATARASASVTVSTPTTLLAPPAPVSMAASVSGSRATLNWRPGTGGSPATEYLLYVSTTSWGQNVIYARSVGNVLTVSGDLPPGLYYARVRARNSAGTSRSSNQVSFVVGNTLAAPTGFVVTWSGTTATLTWRASAADSLEDTPTGYVLEAGTSPELADVASVPLGNVTSFSTDVASGAYYVRVRAVNDLGSSYTTSDIVLVAPGAPGAPTALQSTGSEAVGLQWTAPRGGAAPTGYIVEAGSEPGLSDLAKAQVGNVTEFSTQAPPGTYYVRVRAVNERGAGPASNEIVVQR